MIILLCEESVPVCDSLSRLIKSNDNRHIILTASSKQECISLIHDQKPQVVIIDSEMKEPAYPEVLEHKKYLAPPAVVILLSELQNEHYKKRSLAAGTDYFLHKSVEFEKIPEILKQLCT